MPTSKRFCSPILQLVIAIVALLISIGSIVFSYLNSKNLQELEHAFQTERDTESILREAYALAVEAAGRFNGTKSLIDVKGDFSQKQLNSLAEQFNRVQRVFFANRDLFSERDSIRLISQMDEIRLRGLERHTIGKPDQHKTLENIELQSSFIRDVMVILEESIARLD